MDKIDYFVSCELVHIPSTSVLFTLSFHVVSKPSDQLSERIY